jgi:hypothetical protein
LTDAELKNIGMSAVDTSSNLANVAPQNSFANMQKGLSAVMDDPSKLKDIGGGSYSGLAKVGAMAAAPAIVDMAKPNTLDLSKLGSSASQGHQVVPHYSFSPGMVSPTPKASATGVENTYFNPRYTALTNDQAQQMYPGFPSSSYTAAATGGLMAAYADGGSTMGRNPVEQMSNQNAIGANTGFPQAYIHNNAFATPTQTPISQNVLTGPGDTGVDPYTGEQNMATGGLSDARYNLGGYSDGGRLLRGPGDGVSDSIPAVIGKKQPARLADGEFVVPARIVSELGNGSTEAGARKLYAMMDRIQASRKKTVGRDRVAYNNKTDRHLPA